MPHHHYCMPSSVARMLHRVTLLGLLFIGGASVAWACYTTPRYHLIDVDQQISNAKDVYLAKAVSVAPTDGQEAKFGFVVLQRLAGAERDSFSLPGRTGGTETAPASGDHTDPAFWQTGGGRLFLDIDCQIHPRFVVGKNYLIFLDQPVSRRSFEEITVPFNRKTADKWLAYVTEKLGARS
jgi:hypothetical protein